MVYSFLCLDFAWSPLDTDRSTHFCHIHFLFSFCRFTALSESATPSQVPWTVRTHYINFLALMDSLINCRTCYCLGTFEDHFIKDTLKDERRHRSSQFGSFNSLQIVIVCEIFLCVGLDCASLSIWKLLFFFSLTDFSCMPFYLSFLTRCVLCLSLSRTKRCLRLEVKRPPPDRGAGAGPSGPCLQRRVKGPHSPTWVWTMGDGGACATGGDGVNRSHVRFDNFVQATTCKGTLKAFQELCEHLEVKPSDHKIFYLKLKSKLNYWKAKALWAKLDKRASQKEYKKGRVCATSKVKTSIVRNVITDLKLQQVSGCWFQFQLNQENEKSDPPIEQEQNNTKTHCCFCRDEAFLEAQTSFTCILLVDFIWCCTVFSHSNLHCAVLLCTILNLKEPTTNN